MSDKHRCYQFTWNNYTPEDEEHLQQQKFKYLLYGREVGESGTPHLQGMILFENPRVWNSVRKQVFLEKAHMEVARSMNALKKYNKKDGDFVEIGECPSQGRRTDIEDMVDLVKEGASNRELWLHNPSLMTQYGRAFEKCRYDLFEDRKEPPKVLWLWGGTGIGKTRTAFESHGSVYIKDGTMWWDGYTQQEAIVIDDFDGKWPYRDLLRLLDRYPYQGQVKGGYVRINSPYIYITCEQPPHAIWNGTELEQILRRVSEVRNPRDREMFSKSERNTSAL